MSRAAVSFIGRCTTCKQTYTLTAEQEREARDLGCPFSPCCQAVATIDKVIVERTGVIKPASRRPAE